MLLGATFLFLWVGFLMWLGAENDPLDSVSAWLRARPAYVAMPLGICALGLGVPLIGWYSFCTTAYRHFIKFTRD